MSELKDELHYISDWLESLNPDFLDCYNPGLRRQQIDEIIKDFPFHLSEEVYELYEWKNGFAFDYNLPLEAFLFPEQLRSGVPIIFCSLQDSVYIYKTIREATKYDDEYWNPKWFPIAAYETKRMLYVIGDIEVSPVYLRDVNRHDSLVRIYTNLTSMISVIAECCELGLYQLLPDPYGYGEDDEMVIRIDEQKLELEKEIYRKYNS